MQKQQTALAQLSRAYVSEQLRLDERAGTGIRDDFWIALAGQLVQGRAANLSRRKKLAR